MPPEPRTIPNPQFRRDDRSPSQPANRPLRAETKMTAYGWRSARHRAHPTPPAGQVSSQEEEAAGRHGTGQTAWVKGGRDDQGFPFSVSVTVSVTV